jgi:NitT/TauT family transport system substrate-binding protein
MYSPDPKVLKEYADFAKTSEANAKRSRDEFFPQAMLDPDKVSGIDNLMKDAIGFKFLAAPLTPQQLAELIQIPAKK